MVKIIISSPFVFLLLLFSCSVVSNFLRPHGLQHARLPCPSHLPEFAQIHVHRGGDAIQPSHPLLSLLLLPPVLPSIRVFSNESVLRIRWPKYWSFSFSISPSKEYSGLVSFKIDWFDLLTLQGIQKSLLQHHSSKASILRCSAFFLLSSSHFCTPVFRLVFDYTDLCRQNNVPVF